MKRTYELIPNPYTQSQKSFYGKAKVTIETDYETNDQIITLYSCDIPIIRAINTDLYPLWNDWSAVTGRHIKAFCGWNKTKYTKALENASHNIPTEPDDSFILIDKVANPFS